MPNKAVEPTPNSLRSCVAPAIGRGSPPAFGPAQLSEATALSVLHRIHPFIAPIRPITPLDIYTVCAYNATSWNLRGTKMNA